jgi:hypothetical protein
MLSASQTGTLPRFGGTAVSAAYVAQLRYPFLARELAPSGKLHVIGILLALIQSGLLFSLWRGVAKYRSDWLINAAIVASIVLMGAIAMTSRHLIAADVYAYVGYAKLGLHQAYSPPSVPFGPGYEPVNRLWGEPMIPCIYGPLWLILQILASGWTHSLTQGIVATRALGAISVIAIVFALSRFGVPKETCTIVALNPAILTYYVSDAHNDSLGVVFALLAAFVAPAAPLLAALLVSCGALVKVSLIGLSFVIFRAQASLLRRGAYVVLSLVALGVGSYALAGPPYFHDLFQHALDLTSYTGNNHFLSTHIFRFVELCALAVLGLVFFGRKLLSSGPWPLYAMSGISYPWYVLWGLPYAALDQRLLRGFLIALPTVTALIEPFYTKAYFNTATNAAIVAYVIIELIRSTRFPRRYRKPLAEVGPHLRSSE